MGTVISALYAGQASTNDNWLFIVLNHIINSNRGSTINLMKWIIIISILVSTPSFSKSLEFSTFLKSRSLKYLKTVFKQSEKYSGIKIKVSTLPGQRSLLEANNGNYDGDASRRVNLKNFTKKSETGNLILVKTPLIGIRLKSLRRSETPSFSIFSDVVHKKVAFQRGRKFLESRNKENKWMALNTIDAGVKLLSLKRIDYLLGFNCELRDLMRDKNGIVISDLNYFDENFYLYIHKKHSSIVSKLENSLTKAIEDLRKESFTPFGCQLLPND